MTAVKCVVWDLDETVWPGVAIESRSVPRARPEVLHALSVLEARGIVNSVASRTDPALAAMVRTHPDLAGRFVAPQLGWGHKSASIAVIAAELGIGIDAIAFVDDNPFERAEVANAHPSVRVLAPAELLDRLDTPDFNPDLVTDDARARPRRYREEERRRSAARDFSGAADDFLTTSKINLSIRTASVSDRDRLSELVDRTHRLNTTGEPWPADRIAAMLADGARWLVPVVHLTDRFGDYGLIGAAFVEVAGDTWTLRLFTVSCRAAGRDVPTAFLSRLLSAAHRAGAARLLVEVRPSEANLELRILLRGAGFTPDAPADPDRVVLSRGTDPALPCPPWLTVTEELPV